MNSRANDPSLVAKRNPRYDALNVWYGPADGSGGIAVTYKRVSGPTNRAMKLSKWADR